MRTKISLVAVCAAMLLWMTAFATAQNKPDVQITKGPRIENVTNNSATIAWSTNVNAGTILKYGTNKENLSQTKTEPWGGITHRVHLTNLQPGTTYYFQALSGKGSGTGTGAMSNVENFQTQGSANASNTGQYNSGQSGQYAQNAQTQYGGQNQLNVVVGPIPQQITSNSAVLYWQTQGQGANVVKYGTSPNDLNQTAAHPGGGNTHHVTLNNLQPNTEYYVAIMRQDGSVRATGRFKTEPQGYAQNRGVRITNGPNVEYLSPTEAVIAWSTSAPSSSVVRYGTDMNSLNQSAQAAWGGTTHRVRLNNLQPNTKYWFQIQSGQASGTGTMARSGAYTFQTIQQGQQAMRMQP